MAKAAAKDTATANAIKRGVLMTIHIAAFNRRLTNRHHTAPTIEVAK